MFSTAVREEDEGDGVLLQELEGRGGVRDGLRTADEDTIYAASQPVRDLRPPAGNRYLLECECEIGSRRFAVALKRPSLGLGQAVEVPLSLGNP